MSARSPVRSTLGRFGLVLLAFVLVIAGFMALHLARDAWRVSQPATAFGYAALALVAFLCAMACCLKLGFRDRSAWAGRLQKSIAASAASYPPSADGRRELLELETRQAEMDRLGPQLVAAAAARHRQVRWMRLGLVALAVLMLAVLVAAGLSVP